LKKESDKLKIRIDNAFAIIKLINIGIGLRDHRLNILEKFNINVSVTNTTSKSFIK